MKQRTGCWWGLFWWAFLFTALFLLLTGCSLKKICWDRFPPEVGTDTVEVITTQYVDTTVYVYVQPQHTLDEVPVVIRDTIWVAGLPVPQIISKDTAVARTDFAEAKAWIERNRLALQLVQKDSLIEVRLDSIRTERDHYVKLYTTAIHTAPPEKCPMWRRILLLIIGFTMGLVFARLLKK